MTPAAHYCCGGVKVDTNGETSIRHLYALGETSCTGLHGANRLASNSLIEAVVYADQAARHAASLLPKVDIQEGIPDWDFEGTQHTEEMLMIIQSKREMQTILSNYVGIVRSNLSLKRAMRRLEILWQETEELYNKTKPNRELCELRNMIAVAYLVIKQGREIRSRSAATTTPTTRKNNKGLKLPRYSGRMRQASPREGFGAGQACKHGPKPWQQQSPAPAAPDPGRNIRTNT